MPETQTDSLIYSPAHVLIMTETPTRRCDWCGRPAAKGGYYWTAEEDRLWLGDECAKMVAPYSKKEAQ